MALIRLHRPHCFIVPLGFIVPHGARNVHRAHSVSLGAPIVFAACSPTVCALEKEAFLSPRKAHALIDGKEACLFPRKNISEA